ncbi:DUF5677 domain-containing protein [Methylophaga sulfidovorans]|uniref:Uncharacterized protein n=1 Tax=Methylophaga sulfidovorans TaxID=45496 RepID=A0A1I3ZEA8_9GAMM|nr:DUF5677 domain-containing protein [Methylophaga sulfidovorans]SFK41909.1 hypothetical protein SAMN04488079_11090 [Methylophaga sulfidovorans]
MTDQTSFKDAGFLSEQSRTGTLSVEMHQTPQYLVCEDLSQLGQSILNRCRIRPDDKNEVYLSLYFQRMLSHFQSILLMAERGMIHETEIMSRCLLETLFNLAAFYRHEDFLEAMTDGDTDQRREVLTRFYLKQLEIHALTEQEMDDLERMINSADEINRGDVSTAIKAEMAGLMSEYRTEYAFLSETVHCRIHSVEQDLEMDDHQIIVGIATRAEDTNRLASLLMNAADYLIDGISIILELHKQPEQLAHFEQIKRQVQKVWQNTTVKVAHR